MGISYTWKYGVYIEMNLQISFMYITLEQVKIVMQELF